MNKLSKDIRKQYLIEFQERLNAYCYADKDLIHSDTIIGTYDGVDICHDNVLMTDAYIAVHIETNNKYHFIIIDDLFLKLSNDAKIFVLEHEIGHIETSSNCYWLNEESKIIGQELLADKYAIRKFGREKSVKLLQEIYIMVLDDLCYNSLEQYTHYKEILDDRVYNLGLA